jgi:hypothetical protein
LNEKETQRSTFEGRFGHDNEAALSGVANEFDLAVGGEFLHEVGAMSGSSMGTDGKNIGNGLSGVAVDNEL